MGCGGGKEGVHEVGVVVVFKGKGGDIAGPSAADCAGEGEGVGEVDGVIVQETEVVNVCVRGGGYSDCRRHSLDDCHAGVGVDGRGLTVVVQLP